MQFATGSRPDQLLEQCQAVERKASFHRDVQAVKEEE